MTQQETEVYTTPNSVMHALDDGGYKLARNPANGKLVIKPALERGPLLTAVVIHKPVLLEVIGVQERMARGLKFLGDMERSGQDHGEPYLGYLQHFIGLDCYLRGLLDGTELPKGIGA